MNGHKKRVGILNSGGDCAGLNTVIASIVKAGATMGYEFIGFERGWEGLLNPVTYVDLTPQRVRGISHLGGTILHTVNKGRFAGKAGTGSRFEIPEDILRMAKSNIEKLGLEGLIVIGGDGTLSAADQLAEFGVKIVGIPKSIDNDLNATDKTFGFSTAVQIASDALDKIHTTATSHDRVFFVECMGRHAGWISLFAGLAGSANAILLPEFNVDLDGLVSHLRTRRQAGKTSSVVVVAEGIRLDDGDLALQAHGNTSEVLLGGAAEKLMYAIGKAHPDEFEMRHVVLGHIQRGGSPMSQDRILSRRYGVEAIMALDRGEHGVMIASRNNDMVTVPIADAVGSLSIVTPNTYEYQIARQIGVYVNG